MTLLCNQPPSPKVVWLDQAYFLALFARILPSSYLEPLQDTGPGYELLLAMAKVGERLSLAVTRTEVGAYITTSFGSNLATGTVLFARATASFGVVTVKAGTVVRATNGARDYQTLADVTFGVGEIGPKAVPVRATVADWQHDVPGQSTTLGGQVLPGAVDTVQRGILDPPYGDPTIYAFNADEICGGSPAMLDGLGLDRGIARRTGESDDAYRYRVRQLPDTVSPGAVRRAIAAVFSPLGFAADFIETWQIDYQTCWDAPSTTPGTPSYQPVPPANPLYNEQLFVYDDPRPAYPPFRNRWMDEVDYRGAFIVVVPNLPAMSDVGMAYDDTAVTPADLLTSIGGRAASAYDVPSGFTAAPQGSYDGVSVPDGAGGWSFNFDLAKAAVYKGLNDLLESVRAFGVFVAIELQGQ